MADLFPSAAATDDIGELLHAVQRRIRQRARAELAPLGITPAQARALRALIRSGEPLRMSELADRLHIARRSATTVVDDLAGRGLVERRADPADRRATCVAVTAHGTSVAARMDQRRRDAVAELLGSLEPDEVAELRRLLHRLTAPIS